MDTRPNETRHLLPTALPSPGDPNVSEPHRSAPRGGEDEPLAGSLAYTVDGRSGRGEPKSSATDASAGDRARSALYDGIPGNRSPSLNATGSKTRRQWSRVQVGPPRADGGNRNRGRIQANDSERASRPGQARGGLKQTEDGSTGGETVPHSQSNRPDRSCQSKQDRMEGRVIDLSSGTNSGDDNNGRAENERPTNHIGVNQREWGQSHRHKVLPAKDETKAAPRGEDQRAGNSRRSEKTSTTQDARTNPGQPGRPLKNGNFQTETEITTSSTHHSTGAHGGGDVQRGSPVRNAAMDRDVETASRSPKGERRDRDSPFRSFALHSDASGDNTGPNTGQRNSSSAYIGLVEEDDTEGSGSIATVHYEDRGYIASTEDDDSDADISSRRIPHKRRRLLVSSASESEGGNSSEARDWDAFDEVFRNTQRAAEEQAAEDTMQRARMELDDAEDLQALERGPEDDTFLRKLRTEHQLLIQNPKPKAPESFLAYMGDVLALESDEQRNFFVKAVIFFARNRYRTQTGCYRHLAQLWPLPKGEKARDWGRWCEEQAESVQVDEKVPARIKLPFARATLREGRSEQSSGILSEYHGTVVAESPVMASRDVGPPSPHERQSGADLLLESGTVDFDLLERQAREEGKPKMDLARRVPDDHDDVPGRDPSKFAWQKPEKSKAIKSQALLDYLHSRGVSEDRASVIVEAINASLQTLSKVRKVAMEGGEENVIIDWRATMRALHPHLSPRSRERVHRCVARLMGEPESPKAS